MRKAKPVAERPDVETAILGSGFSGLGMGVNLQRRGLPFVILEQADSLGGTWRDNTYPGCACDIPSALYSFSFAPNPNWSRMYAPQAEIRAYLEDVADRFDLRRHVRFGSRVDSLRFDETAGLWRLAIAGQPELTARTVISAIGAFSRPQTPAIDGLETFAGHAFHSAYWDHAHDLSGKRVAVIGTGASAIQFTPQIAPQVAQLHLFQRTPAWILPKLDRDMTPGERSAFARDPWRQRLLRWIIYWRQEIGAYGFTRNPRFLKGMEALARDHLNAQIADPALRARMTPDYRFGCKRPLISNDFYPALNRSNVEVVSDRIARVTPTSIVTADGRQRVVDTIIFGTGFTVAEDLPAFPVIGRNGRLLNAEWKANTGTHLGMTVEGYPNLFFLVGPNTGLAHNSIIFMAESQMRYIADALAQMRRRKARTMEVKAEAQAGFAAELERRMPRTVWTTGGCQSWYMNTAGKVTALWPGFTFEYRRRTRKARAGDFRFAR